MKFLNSLLLFAIILTAVSACFDPPEFSKIPKIKYSNIYFGDVAFPGQDSLQLTISFQDGDGNLGLNQQEDGPPFNPYDFFVDDSVNVFNVFQLDDEDITPEMRLTRKLSKKKGIDIPEFVDPFDCENYRVDTLYVPAVEAFENLYKRGIYPYKTFTIQTTDGPYTGVVDTFYVESNPNHYNIEVQFFVKDPQHPNADEEGFYEFTFPKDPWPGCGAGFNGRFPFIGRDNDTPMEGTISYTMKSIGFNSSFGNAPFYLSIKIRDRAGNVSNTIKTPAKTLAEIKHR
jgi:hypothetical protein